MQFAGIDEPCRRQQFLCLAYLGEEDLNPQMPIFPVTGIHIEIHFTPWADIDEQTLLHITMNAPHQPHPHAHALDLPAEDDEARPFQPPHQAEMESPAGPLLETQSDFIQALHCEWHREAFSWQGEERCTAILTFFVNHQDIFHHCHQGRPVHQNEHFAQWTERVQHTWRDRIRHDQPLEFHVVTPSPADIEAGIAAYVLVIQAAQPDLATCLVSACEGNIRQS